MEISNKKLSSKKNNQGQYIKDFNEQANNMQEKLGHVSRKMETIRNNAKEMLKVKKDILENQNTFKGLMTGLERLRK